MALSRDDGGGNYMGQNVWGGDENRESNGVMMVTTHTYTCRHCLIRPSPAHGTHASILLLPSCPPDSHGSYPIPTYPSSSETKTQHGWTIRAAQKPANTDATERIRRPFTHLGIISTIGVESLLVVIESLALHLRTIAGVPDAATWMGTYK